MMSLFLWNDRQTWGLPIWNSMKTLSFPTLNTTKKMKIWNKRKLSKISKFYNLGIGQNRKFGNLRNLSFTWNFESSCKSRIRNNKKMNQHKN